MLGRYFLISKFCTICGLVKLLSMYSTYVYVYVHVCGVCVIVRVCLGCGIPIVVCTSLCVHAYVCPCVHMRTCNATSVQCDVGVVCCCVVWGGGDWMYTTGAHNVASVHAPHSAAAESDFGLCPSLSLAGLLADTTHKTCTNVHTHFNESVWICL